MLQCADYLHRVMDREKRKTTIKESLRILRRVQKKSPFEVIAVTGVSGLMVGPEIAGRMGVDIMVIRKGESCHGNDHMEIPPSYNSYPGAVFKYIILDDFISTGNTVSRVIDHLQDNFPLSQFTGFYSWTLRQWITRETLTSRKSKNYNGLIYRTLND